MPFDFRTCDGAEEESLLEAICEVRTGTNVFFLIFCATMVFFMQAGFAMLCAGSVRQKNVKNILLKNLLDACGGALGFWSVGYAFAYGAGDGSVKSFIGSDNFFLINATTGEDYVRWFFQFAFAATAATIVAGTVAERCTMSAYLCYSIMLTGFVYPVVVHSIWDASGFLSSFNKSYEGGPFLGVGMIDFAGSGVVHMSGGYTALCAAKILGPRRGRFYDANGNVLAEPAEFQAHSVPLQVLGTFILWVGWYGFNPGSALMVADGVYSSVAGLCAVTTTIAAVAGCITAMFTDTIIGQMKNRRAEYDLTHAMNGTLSGLVAITAGCSVTTPYAALVIGIIGGWVYCAFSRFLIKLKIDDAVNAIPVHFANGVWGCIATGIFAEPHRAVEVAGYGKAGLFYTGDASLLVCEICGILWIIGWVSVIMVPFFLLLNFLGMFRIDALEEEIGLDIARCKGAAYVPPLNELIARRSTCST